MANNTKTTAKYQNALTLAAEHAARFGTLVRERREALNLRQEDIAFTTGIGRRFIIELEAGKASCQLGKALIVAAAVGLRPFDKIVGTDDDNLLLPDAPEDGKDQ